MKPCFHGRSQVQLGNEPNEQKINSGRNNLIDR